MANRAAPYRSIKNRKKLFLKYSCFLSIYKLEKKQEVYIPPVFLSIVIYRFSNHRNPSGFPFCIRQCPGRRLRKRGVSAINFINLRNFRLYRECYCQAPGTERGQARRENMHCTKRKQVRHAFSRRYSRSGYRPERNSKSSLHIFPAALQCVTNISDKSSSSGLEIVWISLPLHPVPAGGG